MVATFLNGTFIDSDLEQVMQRRPRRNGGFFIIWGSRNRVTDDGSGAFEGVCPSCKNSCLILGKMQREWFTLYFIPIFPTGGIQRFTECSGCHSQFQGNLEEMRQHLSSRPRVGGDFGGAIALFNEMRDTPRDSAKLLRLMTMYMEMGEAGEAVSAGSEFSEAAQESDACLAVMSRAYLKLGYVHAAARHAAAALALNPENAEAAEVQRQLPAGAGS
jgi:hypothetical protein